MLTTDIITDWDTVESMKHEWNGLLLASKTTTVFLTFEWLSSWMHTLGREVQPFIIVLKYDGIIVAIAPLALTKVIKVGISLKILEFIGASMADYSDFIISENRFEYLKIIFDCILYHKEKWDYVELSNITEDSPNWLPLQEVIEYSLLTSMVTRSSICPYVLLDKPIDDYFKLRPKALSYDIRRGEQRLREMGELKYEALRDVDSASAALSDFLKMLERREQATERSNALSAEERLYGFFSSLLKDVAAFKNVHFSRISLNDQAIAYHFGFVDHDKIYWYKPTFDPHYAPYSPGKIMIKEAMSDALVAGLKEFDFLLGNEPYKFQWTSLQRSNHKIWLFSRQAKSRAVHGWLCKLKPLLKDIHWIANLAASFRKTGICR